MSTFLGKQATASCRSSAARGSWPCESHQAAPPWRYTPSVCLAVRLVKSEPLSMAFCGVPSHRAYSSSLGLLKDPQAPSDLEFVASRLNRCPPLSFGTPSSHRVHMWSLDTTAFSGHPRRWAIAR